VIRQAAPQKARYKYAIDGKMVNKSFFACAGSRQAASYCQAKACGAVGGGLARTNEPGSAVSSSEPLDHEINEAA
jgi:hypothetical protein